MWKTAEKAETAAEALGITAARLKGLGLVDRVVTEPLGGAHRDPAAAAAALRRALLDSLREVADLSIDALLQRRHGRLQSYGRFTEAPSA